MWIDKSINLSVCDDIDCEQSLIFYGDSGLSLVSRDTSERQSPRDTKNQKGKKKKKKGNDGGLQKLSQGKEKIE